MPKIVYPGKPSLLFLTVVHLFEREVEKSLIALYFFYHDSLLATPYPSLLNHYTLLRLNNLGRPYPIHFGRDHHFPNCQIMLDPTLNKPPTPNLSRQAQVREERQSFFNCCFPTSAFFTNCRGSHSSGKACKSCISKHLTPWLADYRTLTKNVISSPQTVQIDADVET